MSEFADWNKGIIEEFRANEGRVGGQFEGAPLLLLHTVGRKSGNERVSPVMYLELEGRRYVFASKAGADTSPDWYHNLLSHPEVTYELGIGTHTATASRLSGSERDRIYAEQAGRYPGFAEYQEKTDRVIPVVELRNERLTVMGEAGGAGSADRMEANRVNWDERTQIHVGSRFYDVEGWLAAGSGPRELEIDALGDVRGLRLLHLQCHFGKDTLSWARAGATVTGLDFSPVAIDFAEELASRAGLADRSEFVCANIYDARRALGGATFDVVYVSLGALCWLPDITGWAEEVGGLVSPGGRFFIHEQHPLAWSLADDGLEVEHTYFEEPDPFVEDSEETYTDADRPLKNRRTYEWNHSLGEIVTALLGNGLQIDQLVEHDWTVWPRFSWLIADPDGTWTMPPGMPRIPLTFSLLATRRPRPA